MKNKSILFSLVVVVLFIGIVFYVVNNRKEKEEVIPEDNQSESQIATGEVTVNVEPQTEQTDTSKPMDTNIKKLSNFTPVSNTTSLKKIDVVLGKGEEVKADATVSVHYTGAVASTGDIFQSSKDFGPTPVTFPLSNVIKGWTDGIPGMKVGGTRRLIIPASMAYGSTPPPGSGIPANADLVFDVELIAIK
jgi:FKBP-type peptidyl-prolyl cis-trans isomerase